MRRVRVRVAFVIAAAISTTIAIAAPRRARDKPTAPVQAVTPRPDPRALPGWPLYERHCLACHGARGDGHGPAAPWTWGHPRDLTHGTFAWRSTPVGAAATDDDLRAALRFGAPGTSMPGFADILADDQLDQLIAVVRAFTVAPPPAGIAIVLHDPPPADPQRGAELWQRMYCTTCHGPTGEGDGSAAAAMAAPPYDLTRELLHRPRDVRDPAALRRAAALSIATGIAGTAMPGYLGAASEADVWALADHVAAINASAHARDGSTLDADAIDGDREQPVPSSTWPGDAGDPDAQLFGGPIAPQGPPPTRLAPAQASLHARQCGRCHAKQVREWQASIHAQAISPGVTAQIDHGFAPSEVGSCQRCHAPLAEQLAGTPAYDPDLRDEGVTCAGCHLRQWTRHGPPGVAPSLLPSAAYPLVTQPIYERADLCLPCHQLPPRLAVAGKPLLNTYKEWLESPYMPRGVQCQHCHMPNREHAWLGVHDPDTVRQGVEVSAAAHRAADDGGALTVVATVKNIGAGHFLPTTATPQLVLAIELVDRDGTAIAGARGEQRIGRDVVFDTAWHELADTRIPPGGSRTMARAWRGGRIADAAWARVTLEVQPDAYYEGFYRRALAGPLGVAQRAQYEQALERATGSHYVAEYRVVPIEKSNGLAGGSGEPHNEQR